MSLVRSRRAKLLLLSSSFALVAYFLRRHRRHLLLKRRRLLITVPEPETSLAVDPSTSVPKKNTINKQFFHQLRVLVRILVPGFRSDSFLLLVTHLTTLLTRTFLSVYIAHLDGAIVKSLVQRNPRDFLRSICIFLAVAVPASFINSFIRFAESKLGLAFRTRLTRHAYEAYFRVSASRLIESVDVLMCSQIETNLLSGH